MLPEEKTEVVVGPPGTGKTTTLLTEVEGALERGVPPDRVGYVSFTRQAAEEAISRACARFNRGRGDFPYFRTLHSLCYRHLGLSSSDVMDGKRLQEFAEYAGIPVTGRWSTDGDLASFAHGDRILFIENLARVRRVPLMHLYDESFDDDRLSRNAIERVARALRAFKDSRGLMDYTDMLIEFARQEGAPKIEELFVDEAQDLSPAQWDVVERLALGSRRVVVAGDDDQGVYRWAGADIDYLINLRGRERVLEQSWRVPVLVQRKAMEPISGVRNRRQKTWRPREERGVVDTASHFYETDLTGQDVLVLARNDYVLREQVEPELRRRGILYSKHGHPSVRESMLRAVLAWESLRRGEGISGEEVRVVYAEIAEGRGIARGHKKLDGLLDEETYGMGDLRARHGLLTDAPWFDALDRLPRASVDYVRAALRHGERLRGRPRVRLSTIHGSKGGEAEHVILMTEMAQRTHREMERNVDDERRVWYVGVTRAKTRLTTVRSATRECPWL